MVVNLYRGSIHSLSMGAGLTLNFLHEYQLLSILYGLDQHHLKK